MHDLIDLTPGATRNPPLISRSEKTSGPRIAVPDVDAEGRFAFDPAAEELICIGCGCSDSRACPGGCCWVAADETVGLGLCSQCAEKPLHELLRQQEA